MKLFAEKEKQFAELVNNDKLAHAYVFYGADLDACRDFAVRLANFLETGIFNLPSGFLSDFLAVEPNENGNIGIDEVRHLQNFLYQRPSASKKRTAIVSAAETLTGQAQSAILKIAEEPPPDSLIIIVARHPDNLLPTVSSRLQKVDFGSLKGKGANKNEQGLSDENDEYFIKVLEKLKKDPKKNSFFLKEVLRRYSLFKQYNLNKKLQMKYLDAFLKKEK